MCQTKNKSLNNVKPKIVIPKKNIFAPSVLFINDL